MIRQSQGVKNFTCLAQTAANVTYSWNDVVIGSVTSPQTATGPNYIVPSTTPGYHTLTCTVTTTDTGSVTCPTVSVSINTTVVGMFTLICKQNELIVQQLLQRYRLLQ